MTPVPCDVADYFFRRIDFQTVGQRLTGGAIGRFAEAWWLFPEVDETENSCYIAFNFQES